MRAQIQAAAGGPSRTAQIAERVPGLLTLIAEGKIELFADNIFPLTKVKKAFEALSSRRTIGEVDLNSLIKGGSHYVSKKSLMNLHVVSVETEFEA